MTQQRDLTASGRRFALATPHAAATDAGRAAFESGGNAVDAALAACAVLAVVYPHMCSLGGDLFALVRRPDGRLIALDGSGASPAGLSIGTIAGAAPPVPTSDRPEPAGRAPVDKPRSSDMPVTGPHTVTVPGILAGWSTLHAGFARLPWGSALSAAIAAASDGVAVARSLAAAIAEQRAELLADPGLGAVFCPDGKPLSAGDTLRQPALTRTLEIVARRGADGFYRGEAGGAYAAGLAALGSRMTRADLAAHETRPAEPLVRPFGPWRIATTPPGSQGYVLLQILALIERLDLRPDVRPGDAALLARVFRETAAERDRSLAQAEAMTTGVDELLDDGHIADLAARLTSAGGHDAPAGAAPPRGDAAPRGDTIAVVAADAEGNAVSVIQSVFHSFGAGLLEPATGIVCQNRGAGFSLDPASPNALAGGKRPAHTLMPVMALNDGRPAVVAGTMGGKAQPQIHAHILGALVAAADDRGPAVAGAADLGTLIARPRWIVGDGEEGGESDVVVVERGAQRRDGDALATTGLPLVSVDDCSEEVGHAQYIAVGDDGRLTSASDPRADGSAAAG
jgi:gamma-glutamyltranspeptidase